MPQPSDETLFAAWLGGDDAAFEELFRRWQAPLQRHLSRMLDDPAAAEDIVVETFLRLHWRRDRLDPHRSPKPFVWTIARNLARNRRRAQRLWGWLPLGAAEAERIAPPPRDDEASRRVAQAFAALPAAQREACSLRFLGELSVAEIAAVTGVSLGTAKSRLFYGIRTLRTLLADLAPGKE